MSENSPHAHGTPTPPATWPPLASGATLQIVKLNPMGIEAARYPGVVMAEECPDPWIGLRATWVTPKLSIDGLRLVPGDRLHEFFSPVHPFNVFSVFSPEGALRGWYANVTFPTRLDPLTEPPTLIWHDLYLDLIALPTGETTIRDEDELADSGLAHWDPTLHATIVAACDELMRLYRAREFPFHER